MLRIVLRPVNARATNVSIQMSSASIATVLHGTFAIFIPAAISLARTWGGLRIWKKVVCIPNSIVKSGRTSCTIPFLRVSRPRKRKNIGPLFDRCQRIWDKRESIWVESQVNRWCMWRERGVSLPDGEFLKTLVVEMPRKRVSEKVAGLFKDEEKLPKIRPHRRNLGGTNLFVGEVCQIYAILTAR